MFVPQSLHDRCQPLVLMQQKGVLVPFCQELEVLLPLVLEEGSLELAESCVWQEGVRLQIIRGYIDLLLGQAENAIDVEAHDLGVVQVAADRVGTATLREELVMLVGDPLKHGLLLMDDVIKELMRLLLALSHAEGQVLPLLKIKHAFVSRFLDRFIAEVAQTPPLLLLLQLLLLLAMETQAGAEVFEFVCTLCVVDLLAQTVVCVEAAHSRLPRRPSPPGQRLLEV